MFTTCPKCALNLAITAADLRIGQGYVRCGRCSNVFNALVGLADDGENAIVEQPTMPAATEAEPVEDAEMLVEAGLVEGDPGTGTFETIILEGDGIMQTTEVVAEDEVQEQLQALADRIEAQQHDLDEQDAEAIAAIPLADSGDVEVIGLRGEATLDQPPLPDDPVEQADVTFDDASEERGRLLRSLAGFGVGLLGLLLVGQLVHHYRARLAGFTPLVAVYEALGVPIEPQVDLGSYDVRQLGYEANPRAKDSVLIRASVQNVGKVSQPLPLLRVTMQDRFGNLTQRVELAPRDYLLAQSGAKPLAPGARVDARIQVRMPDQPVDYQLDVCTADHKGRLRCADDRGPFQ